MLAPKKVKHRKWHKGRKRWSTTETRGTKVDFGSFGLKSDGLAWITSRQIEAARRAMTRHIDRIGKTWIRIFPDKPVTKKGDETAMGQGKGSLDHYVAVVRPGRIIFEIDGVAEDVAREAFRLAAAKLPVLTKFVKRQ